MEPSRSHRRETIYICAFGEQNIFLSWQFGISLKQTPECTSTQLVVPLGLKVKQFYLSGVSVVLYLTIPKEIGAKREAGPYLLYLSAAQGPRNILLSVSSRVVWVG